MALTTSSTPSEMHALLVAYHQRLRWAQRNRMGAAVAVAVGGWWLVLAVVYYLDWLAVVLPFGLIGTGGLLLGAILLDVRQRPSLADTARLLDARLDDRQRLTTAVELLDGPPPGALAQAQLATSAALLGRADPRLVVPARVPWPMAIISAGLLLLALSLFILKQAPNLPFGLGNLPSDSQGLAALPAPTPASGLPGSDQPPVNVGGSPDADTAPPQLGPGSDPISAAQRLASAEAQAALDRLAAALDEQSVTQAAADSLRQGAYGQAADQLTEVGKQNDQLSSNAQQGLAAALDRAAQDTPSPPELQKAEQNAVTALQSGDYGQIADALKALGDAVRQAGDQVITQPDLAKRFPDPAGQRGSGQGGVPDPSASGAAGGPDAGGATSGADAPGTPGPQDSQGTPTGDSGTQSGQGTPSGQGQDSQGSSADQSGSGAGAGDATTSGTGGGNGQAGQTGTAGTDPPGTGAASGDPGEGSRVSGPDDSAPLDVAGTPFELQNQPNPNQPGPPDPDQPPGLTVDGEGAPGSPTTPLAPGAAGNAPSESNQVPVDRWEPVQRYFSHDATK